MLPISSSTWEKLVELNWSGADLGLFQKGVFATGVGPDYQPERGILYVGKSAGPLGSAVGPGFDQGLSGQASREWMVGRRNRSPFWQAIDQIDPSRRTIAWTNVCKMDKPDGKTPPGSLAWWRIREECLTALKEELDSLRPRVTVFAISHTYRSDVIDLMDKLGFRAAALPFSDGWTSAMRHASGRWSVVTRHPQGWSKEPRNQMMDFARSVP